MHIIELLNTLSYDQVNQLAKQWEIPYGKPIKIEHTKKLISEAYSEAAIQRVLSQLPLHEKQSLEMLAALSSAYQNGMSVQDAARKVDELLGVRGHGEKTVNALSSKGLVFFIRQYWKDHLVVPHEIWSTLTRELAVSIVQRIAKRSAVGDKVHVLENNSLALHHDMLTLLASFIHENVEISQKGHIYKRTMNRLVEKFRSGEERFPPPFGVDVPRNFYFLQAFIDRTSLADLDSVARVNIQSLEAFLAVPYVEWVNTYHDFYLRSIHLGGSLLPVSFLYSIFYRLGKEHWVRADVVFEEISRLLDRWKVPLKSEHLDLACYNPFVAFGLMQWGRDEHEHPVWKWTPWGMEYILRNLLHHDPDQESKIADLLTTDIYVQPNLEIIVPENILPAIRWKVEALAELKQADSVFIYTLSRKRILQALESGWTIELIRAFFDHFSKVSVSPNVYKTIEDWTGNFGKAVLWDVMVLEVKDPSIAEWLAKDKKLSKLIVTSFSTQSFVIKRSDEKLVRSIMAEMGILIPSRVTHPDRSSATKNRRLPSRMNDKNNQLEAAQLHNLSAFDPERYEFAMNLEEVASNRLLLDGSVTSNDIEDDNSEDYDRYDY